MRKTLNQIVESIFIASNGGAYLDEASVPSEAVEAKVDEARNIVMGVKWSTNNRRTIHPDWVQEYFPEYNADLQDEPHCTVYRCPGMAYFDKNVDGYVHVGAKDCPENFQRVWNRSELASRMRHPVMKAGRRILVLREADRIEFYASRRILDPKIIAVFSSPVEIPTFNKAKDPYPLDSDSIEMVEKFVRESYMRMAIGTSGDMTSDSVFMPTQYKNPLLNRGK